MPSSSNPVPLETEGARCHVGPLDFVVFGIPRSGTSVLVQTINCHSNVFCGMEHLPLRYRLDDLLAPGMFFRDDLAEENKKKIEALRTRLGAFEILRFGNKQPRYYMQLDRLRAHNPSILSIAVYRPISAVAASWTRRAGLADDRWDPNGTGIFAIAEAFLFAARLAEEGSDTLLVSYEDMFFKDADIAVELLRAIGLDRQLAEFRYRFTRKFFRSRGGSAEHPARPADLVEAFRILDLDALDDLVLSRPLRPSSEIRGELAAFVGRHGDRLAGVMVDHLRASPDDRATYARAWLAKVARSVERGAPETRRFALDLGAEVTRALDGSA